MSPIFHPRHPVPLITSAIRREKRLKEWKRTWKLALIEQANPDWRDLLDDITA